MVGTKEKKRKKGKGGKKVERIWRWRKKDRLNGEDRRQMNKNSVGIVGGGLKIDSHTIHSVMWC